MPQPPNAYDDQFKDRIDRIGGASPPTRGTGNGNGGKWGWLPLVIVLVVALNGVRMGMNSTRTYNPPPRFEMPKIQFQPIEVPKFDPELLRGLEPLTQDQQDARLREILEEIQREAALRPPPPVLEEPERKDR